MEQDPNGTNSSDTTHRPDNSTINVERSLISKITRMKKVNTLELMMLRKEDNNKDGPSSMSIKWIKLPRTELEAEDSRLINHSTSNQDYGWKELSLTTLTIMLTLHPENHKSTKDNFGYMMKPPRQSSLTIPSRRRTTKREYSTTEAVMLPFKTWTQDGTNSLLISQVDIFTLTNHSVLMKSTSYMSMETLMLK